jgi:pimeloyl-ACP methyl ester carboxylesterase
MTTFITVHGIRSRGDNNVDLMGEKLQSRGHRIVDFDYPTVNMLDVLLKMRGTRPDEVKKHARRLSMLLPGLPFKPDVVAHSMGCLVTLRAMEEGGRFGTVFFFAPAMNADFVIPSWGCEKLVIIFNPHDKAIAAGNLLRYHPFGDMGRKGSIYAKYDHRIRNIRCEDRAGGWLNHNYPFEPEHIDYWTDYVEAKV